MIETNKNLKFLNGVTMDDEEETHISGGIYFFLLLILQPVAGIVTLDNNTFFCLPRQDTFYVMLLISDYGDGNKCLQK